MAIITHSDSSAIVQLMLTRAGQAAEIGTIAAETSTGIFAETTDLDLGNPQLAKEVQRVLALVTGLAQTTELTLQVKYRNRLTDPLVSMPAIVIGGGSVPVKMRVPAARYIRLRISEAEVSAHWSLFGFEFWGAIKGKRF